MAHDIELEALRGVVVSATREYLLAVREREIPDTRVEGLLLDADRARGEGNLVEAYRLDRVAYTEACNRVVQRANLF